MNNAYPPYIRQNKLFHTKGHSSFGFYDRIWWGLPNAWRKNITYMQATNKEYICF